MNDVFTQEFELWQPTQSTDSESGISTDDIKDEYTYVKKVFGILTKKSAVSVKATDSSGIYSTYKQVNIRLNPKSIDLKELNEGDQIRHIDANRTYFVKAIYPAFEPPQLKKLLHIRLEVIDNSGIDENQDN